MTDQLWVCAACGKSASMRDGLRDASCYVNAIEVIPSSVVRDSSGRVVSATVVSKIGKLTLKVSAGPSR